MLRHRSTSDEGRSRLFGFGALATAVGLGAALALAPRGSVSAPGPLSAPHTRAKIACATCHDAPPSTNATVTTVPEIARGTDACRRCHGEHPLRGGHARAAANGLLTCATCHAAHAAETVEFGVTHVPIVRAGRCNGCHDASRVDDPLRACIDRSGASKPALLVRCLDEHDHGPKSERGVCAAQHTDGRFAAREAALRVVAGTSLPPASGAGFGPFLGGVPIAFGALGLVLARLVKKKKRPKREANDREPASSPKVARAGSAIRKLPVIDASRCLGCYACVDVCPFDVLEVERYVAVVARPEACCGAVSCEAACPNGSLVMREEGASTPGLRLTDQLESEIAAGIFFAGDVTGVPLIKNAIVQGRTAIDAVRARRDAMKQARAKSTATADVLIIGAGPAGLAASLRAEEVGLSYVTLEQSTIAASIKSFPRGKLVFDAPIALPLEGEIAVRECSKEELVGHWTRIVRSRQPRILEQHRVVGLAASEGATYRVTYERSDGSRSELAAGAIVVAVGQRGTPRRLDATIEPAAESMVFDALFDARSFAGKRVVVVGLGDSALEAIQALAHQPGTEVTVVHRGSGYSRGRSKSIAEVQALALSGRVRVRFESKVTHVRPGEVVLQGAQGSETLEADAVLALLGGVPSATFLEPFGLTVR